MAIRLLWEEALFKQYVSVIGDEWASVRIAREAPVAPTEAGLGKPRHQISSDVGMHRETLLSVLRGERPIAFYEAARIVTACGAFPRLTIVLALAGQEDLARKWMRSEMGADLEEFFSALPTHLERTFGRRVEDVRPRWVNGSSLLGWWPSISMTWLAATSPCHSVANAMRVGGDQACKD